MNSDENKCRQQVEDKKTFICPEDADIISLLHPLNTKRHDRKSMSVDTKVSNFVSMASTPRRTKQENKRLEPWEADAKSKRGMRYIVFTALLIILVIQVYHMNCAISTVIDSVFERHDVIAANVENDARYIPENLLLPVIEMLKWYIGATVVELIGAFIFIIKSVFETPKNPDKDESGVAKFQ